MKATLWLLPALIALFSVTNNVSAQQYGNTRLLQNAFLIPQTKRTKPSLSIVNPLDVLRQRIILEMARRQMRENTKQVEINKAYLKNIGKRGPVGNDVDYTVFDDFERHLLDTNSYKTPQYDDNPAPPVQFMKLSNFRQHQPDNFFLAPNLEQHPQLAKIGYVNLSPMDGVSTKNRLMANKVNENSNKIMDNDQSGDDNHNDETIPKDNNGPAGAGNDDDNFQIKYMYSLYKNRYNVNNNGNNGNNDNV